MTTMIALYNADRCVGRCDARCYNAKTKTCSCICGGVNHAVGRQQAVDQTRAYFEDFTPPAIANADPNTDFRMIRVLPNATQRAQLPHPNQTLLFYQPPMNELTKALAQALATTAMAAILAGCNPTPKPPTPTIVARVVIIYESSAIDPADMNTINSEPLRTYLTQHGYWYRFCDKNILDPHLEPPPEITPYLNAANGHPLPWLMFADAQDKINTATHLPPNPADIIALLQAHQP